MARNTSFRFKQFTIQQDRCAMKVCTDACVFGAWADVSEATRVLDIGAGTGLLSLMAAQRNRSAEIDAVEYELQAAGQAIENVTQSIFSDRINVVQCAIQSYDADVLYDCIISNPPFFQSDLRSPDLAVNQAHHADTLTFADLLEAVNRFATPDGVFHVLLPVPESIVFEQMANRDGWGRKRSLLLFHHRDKQPFRRLLSLRRSELTDTVSLDKELCIYEPDGRTYTQVFQALMKDFYLIF